MTYMLSVQNLGVAAAVVRGGGNLRFWLGRVGAADHKVQPTVVGSGKSLQKEEAFLTPGETVCRGSGGPPAHVQLLSEHVWWTPGH